MIPKDPDLDSFMLGEEDTIQDAILCLNNNRKGIVLVVDSEGLLVNTITDGDIRRATLDGLRLNESLGDLLERKQDRSAPVTASPDSTDEYIIGLMEKRRVQQVPLVDDDNRLVGLKTLPDFVSATSPRMNAVIMAGGFGTRLHPLTTETPKPMLPLGDRPMLEFMLDKLKQAGIHQVHISTHHLGEQIKRHFGSGQGSGLNIDYLSESQPLGTAGALRLMRKTDEPLLVINGDIITDLDFMAMLLFHEEHNADMTVAVRQYDIQVPYGVLKSSGNNVIGLEEKPVLTFLVNAGIYLLSPGVTGYIPESERFDMTDLIKQLVQQKRTVTNFPVHEYWLDVGQHADYEKAREDVEKGVFPT